MWFGEVGVCGARVLSLVTEKNLWRVSCCEVLGMGDSGGQKFSGVNCGVLECSRGVSVEGGGVTLDRRDEVVGLLWRRTGCCLHRFDLICLKSFGLRSSKGVCRGRLVTITLLGVCRLGTTTTESDCERPVEMWSMCC